MNALMSLSDISTSVDDKPRIRDVVLAEKLGFERPRTIRELIERNRDEIKTYGNLPHRTAKSPDALGRGRPASEYWLNEPQCVLLCMFARTANAAAVRKAVINIFQMWRRRHVPLPATTPLPAPEAHNVHMDLWCTLSEASVIAALMAARR